MLKIQGVREIVSISSSGLLHSLKKGLQFCYICIFNEGKFTNQQSDYSVRFEVLPLKYFILLHHEKHSYHIDLKPIATKRSKSWYFFQCNFCDFLNFSLFFDREYRSRRLDTSHSKVRYLIKPQIFLQTIQKTGTCYLYLGRFAGRPKLETNSPTPCIIDVKQMS